MTKYSVEQVAPNLNPPRYRPSGLSRRALLLAHEYIVENLGERVTPDDLAEAIGLSRFHFARVFRKSTGESPMRYVQRCRVEHAKRLITRGEWLMAEIAVTVGFYDQSHFSRWFRKLVGMTPREFARGSMQDRCESEGGAKENPAGSGQAISAALQHRPTAALRTSVVSRP